MSAVALRALQAAAAAPAPASAAAQAERVILISLQKSGTHLVAELMHALGYSLMGAARIAPERLPRLARATRQDVMGRVHGPFGRVAASALPPGRFERMSDAAWETLAWSWRERLGLQIVSHYDQASVETLCRRGSPARLSRTRFAETPPGICWIFHELDATRVDGAFMREWTETGTPAIIFNYRDPRDVLLSFVNYLAGRTLRGIGNFSHYWSFHKTLASLPDLQSQLAYAIRDPAFPGHNDFAKSLWMLNHPMVCKTSFEELVGGAGGGSEARQAAAVARVMRHLGVAGDAHEVAARLYRRDAFTFFRGQIGAWEQVFTAEHRRAFRREFTDLPELYGYQPTGPA
jgi:hypothetical protein